MRLLGFGCLFSGRGGGAAPFVFNVFLFKGFIMRNIVFSKFFKSAVKVARCSGVAAYKRGIEIDFHPLHAFFDWPDGVTFDGCDLKVDGWRA